MSVGSIGESSSRLPHLEKINEVILKQNPHKKKHDRDVEELKEKISKEALDEKVSDMNEMLIPTETSLRFQLHEQSDEYYVQIIDDKTNEVIREIPDRKFLEMYAAMAELVGIVVDEKI
ncbi:flagellar protein FlaG [Pseudalkalibacillus sp. SCS-8]|uniref:flagellar protein FlaG n=1 Tax=Pseudalkalibacillus nanhaiensis TaxID=3115291 RepID=UPI0032DB302A